MEIKIFPKTQPLKCLKLDYDLKCQLHTICDIPIGKALMESEAFIWREIIRRRCHLGYWNLFLQINNKKIFVINIILFVIKSARTCQTELSHTTTFWRNKETVHLNPELNWDFTTFNFELIKEVSIPWNYKHFKVMTATFDDNSSTKYNHKGNIFIIGLQSFCTKAKLWGVRVDKN